MNPIQMVDLKSQYLRIKPEMDAATSSMYWILPRSFRGHPLPISNSIFRNILVPSMLLAVGTAPMR